MSAARFSAMRLCSALSVVPLRSKDGIGDGWYNADSHFMTRDQECTSRASARAFDGEACVLRSPMSKALGSVKNILRGESV